MRRASHLSLIMSAAALLGACASAPTAPTPPAEMASGEFLGSLDSAAFVSDWWTKFDDPDLSAIIIKALEANKSIAAAEANLRVAETIAGRTRLDNSFETGTNASAEVGRAARPGQDVAVSVTSGIGASWEIDLFGRISAQIDAAEFDVEAARQARRDVAVLVAGQAAQTYIQLRGAQRRLQVARENAETQKESLSLVQTLLDNGRATQLDLERAQAQYRTTLASLPLFEATIRGSVSALAALTGAPANAPDEALLALVNGVNDIPEHQGAIAAGSVEALIRRRPDIRQAEAIIARQLSLSDSARADLFPTVTLNADLLGLFDDVNDPGDLNTIGFGIGPSIRWAGPDLRRVRANIKIADARADLAIAQYEQTVIAALGEVEIALTDYVKELERRSDLTQAASSARRALELANLRFEEGVDDYLDVLEAQRTLLDAEDRLAQSRLQASIRAIAAYRALGGVGL